MRTITPVLPTETGVRDGLAYSLWVPERRESIKGGIVILHGAGSCKENHHDFARDALAAGFASVAFDQRGHGSSEGPMDAHVLDDVSAMASLLRSSTGVPDFPVALRGSSLGGYLAILAAPVVGARAVVAICPASAEGLRRGLAAGALPFVADLPVLDSFLERHDLYDAVEALEIPLLLLHAEGDEQVPVEHSRELARRASVPASRLIAVPGGHHRSIQHDAELRAVSLHWIERAFGPAGPRAPSAWR
jgi:alpha-beta hydrolase superfamily lysophospholipase